MTDAASMPWPGLLALGAGHGINPGMGWLFAVALGLQRGTRRAVLGALLPLAVGHAAAIGATVAVAAAVGLVLPPSVLRYTVAALLIGLGARRLVRTRHPRFGGMQVRARELAVWSFLMASAHGAGLMVLPLLLGPLGSVGSAAHHTMPLLQLSEAAITPVTGDMQWDIVLAATAHAVGYLAVTAGLAVLVYERLGLRLLRTAWVNFDLIWAAALVVAGVGTLAA